MSYSLSNIVSAAPENCNVGYNNSWIKVDNNAQRHLFAQANYITNLDDIRISLSASELTIGSVLIADPDNKNLVVNVVDVGMGMGALRVVTQDLDPDADTVSLADILKNNVGVFASLSALKTYTVNPVTAVNVSNSSLAVTVRNPVSSFILINPVTAVSVNNQVTAVTVNNPITAVTIRNPISSFSLVNPVTSFTIDNQLTAISINNLISSFSLINPVTAVTIINPITSVTINNLVSSFSLVNPVTSVTVNNPVNNLIVNYDSSSSNANLDAFGRLRISAPTTLFDSKTLHNKSSLFWTQEVGGDGAAVNFTGLSDASVTLSASNINEYAIRQTTQRFNYQPGKSQMAMFTSVLTPVPNAIKRCGLFQSLTASPYTPNIGLFFETLTMSSSSIKVVQLNEGFLVPSRHANREDWNIDKLDGAGISGKTLQLSAANIFLIDYEWLGVGRVRYGVVIDGKICYCHEFNNAGDVQGAYIRTPNLPVRAEIRQTAPGRSSMKFICSTVMSEGGENFTGVTRSVDSGSKIQRDNILQDSRRAIVGVRLQYNKLDSVNEVLNASVMFLPKSASTQAPFKYEILHNPTLASAGTWTDASEDSNFQYWNGNSDIVNTGTVIASGFASVGAALDLSANRFEKFLRMGCAINGKRDELFLVVTPLQDHDGAFGSITFIESD